MRARHVIVSLLACLGIAAVAGRVVQEGAPPEASAPAPRILAVDGGGAADAGIDLVAFCASGRRPPPPPASLTPCAGFSTGTGLEVSEIVSVVDPDLEPAVRVLENLLLCCYDARRAERPDLAGRVALDLRVDSDGTVGDAVVAHDTLLDPAVVGCLGGLLRGSMLPRPASTVRIVLTFSAALPPGVPDPCAGSTY